jgi:hypothetical protein
MGHGLEPSGGYAERELDGTPQTGSLCAELRDIDENARPQPELVERGAVLIDGDLVGGAGVVEV